LSNQVIKNEKREKVLSYIFAEEGTKVTGDFLGQRLSKMQWLLKERVMPIILNFIFREKCAKYYFQSFLYFDVFRFDILNFETLI